MLLSILDCVMLVRSQPGGDWGRGSGHTEIVDVVTSNDAGLALEDFFDTHFVRFYGGK